jgi:predicted transposase YdaD
MPGEFDSTTRSLVERYPADWLAYLGRPAPGSVRVVDANLATVSAEADRVVLVGGARPWLAHLEFQSSYDATIGQRLVRYNAMLHLRHGLPVASTLVLLRRKAGGRAITGRYRVSLPDARPYLSFRYGVRRLWREPAADLLAGPLGTLPLAPLGDVTRQELAGLLRAMDQRFAQEAAPAEADYLRVVTYTLLGLNYSPRLVDQLMPGLQHMRDSSTYQAILNQGREEGREEGRAEGEHRLIMRLGSGRLGAPDEVTRSQIERITDIDTLERLFDRVQTVSSWAELLSDLR